MYLGIRKVYSKSQVPRKYISIFFMADEGQVLNTYIYIIISVFSL